MESYELAGQRRIRRSPSVRRPFAVLFAATGVLLATELSLANVPAGWRGDWPWRIRLMGIPVTGSLLVALIVSWIARDQFAKSVTPVLRYVSRWVGTAQRVEAPADRYRQVLIRNAGPGTLLIAGVRWQVATTLEPAVTHIASMEALRESLAALGLQDAADYAMTNFTPGTALAAGEERLCFECSDAALGRFVTFDAVFEFESLLGDRYEKTISALPRPGASAAVTTKEASAAA